LQNSIVLFDQIAYLLVLLLFVGPIVLAIPTTMKSSIFIDNPPGKTLIILSSNCDKDLLFDNPQGKTNHLVV
jgi:hypothetical protein